MNKTKLNKSEGFTLVELLLVVGLLGLSVGVTTDILLSLVRSYNKTQVMNEVEQQASFVSLKLEKELRNAQSVVTPTPELGSNSIKLVDRNLNSIYYRLEGDVLKRGVATGSMANLTDNSAIGGVAVTCNSPCFELVNDSPQAVKINLTFSQASTTGLRVFQGTVNVSNVIVIRSTY